MREIWNDYESEEHHVRIDVFKNDCEPCFHVRLAKTDMYGFTSEIISDNIYPTKQKANQRMSYLKSQIKKGKY